MCCIYRCEIKLLHAVGVKFVIFAKSPVSIDKHSGKLYYRGLPMCLKARPPSTEMHYAQRNIFCFENSTVSENQPIRLQR